MISHKLFPFWKQLDWNSYHNFSTMPDHENDELAQENNSLRERVDTLEKRETSLESDLDEVRSELRSEK